MTCNLHNYPVRSHFSKILLVFSSIELNSQDDRLAGEGRYFLGRAVRYLAGEGRIRQFLDIGHGAADRG